MSRGGRGGGRGGRGGMRGNPLPFDVDLDLVDSAQGSVTDVSDENKAKQLFPLIEQIIPAPLATEERRLFVARGEMKTKYRKSHIWTGTRKQIDTLNGSKDRAKAVWDAFDAGDTYSKRKRARQIEDFVPPEKRKLPKMNEDMTPQGLVRDAKDAAAGTNAKKKSASTTTAGAKKSVTDKLATLDEAKDDEGNKSDDESVDGAAKAGDGENEDAASEPQDSEFEEDDADDADNDYNAENYFSGGEGDDGDEGGDDGDEGESDKAFNKGVRVAITGAMLVAAGMASPRYGALVPGTPAWEQAKRRWE